MNFKDVLDANEIASVADITEDELRFDDNDDNDKVDILILLYNRDDTIE